MDDAVRLSTFEELDTANPALAYWLSRPPHERIAEVERLRREFVERLRGTCPSGASKGLRGFLRLVERTER